VKLRSGGKDLIELADIAIVHQVKVELNRVSQLLSLGLGHRDLPLQC
jgi:hypothetical protein